MKKKNKKEEFERIFQTLKDLKSKQFNAGELEKLKHIKELEKKYMSRQMTEMEKRYYECYLCARDTLINANNIHSWSGKIEPSSAYTKATKEYLNGIIAEYLFLKFDSPEEPLSEENLKHYIIQRIFKKSELWDIRPEEKAYLERRGLTNEYTHTYMCKTVISNYPGAYEYLKEVFCSELTEAEKKIFEVAKVAATKIEFESIKNRMSEINRKETQKDIEKRERDIHLSDYLNEEEFEWFVKLTDASRMVRWAKYLKGPIFNDSTHMLLTALLADLITKECNELGFTNEDPTKAFFTGLFHDIIEVWTGDAPSPCKDEIFFENIGKHLREVFEDFEKYVYKKYFYKYMDPELEEAFAKKVVFEEGTSAFSQIIKNADYLSADFEVYTAIKMNILDKGYFDVVKRSFDKAIINAEKGSDRSLKERTPAATFILADMYAYTSKVVLPKI